MLERVVSGGQTGVDRAALDVALEMGMPCGGWCPRGRRAEDGPISESYPLQETRSAEYRQRTIWNIRDSNGTLILLPRGWRALSGGTALTRRVAHDNRKPYWIVHLSEKPDIAPIQSWIVRENIRILNIAGPRASHHRQLYRQARRFLSALFSSLL